MRALMCGKRYVGTLCFWVDSAEGPLNERLDRRVLQMRDVSSSVASKKKRLKGQMGRIQRIIVVVIFTFVGGGAARQVC